MIIYKFKGQGVDDLEPSIVICYGNDKVDAKKIISRELEGMGIAQDVSEDEIEEVKIGIDKVIYSHDGGSDV